LKTFAVFDNRRWF